MTEAILRELLSMQPVSGEALARRLGLTRAAVWKHIKALQAAGTRVEGVTGKGYKLLEWPDYLSATAIDYDLNTKAVGRNIALYDTLDSTNTEAKRLAVMSAPHGTAVLARQQTQGKGRKNRNWIPPEKGLFVSLLLRPDIPPAEAPQTTIVVALAVAHAIRGLTELQPRIKWPNDILLDGKKVCGISLHMSADAETLEYLVSGIGVNIAGTMPEELNATTLQTCGQAVNINQLAANIFNQFEGLQQTWESEGFAAVMRVYRSLSATLHQWVRVYSETDVMEGYAEDFDDAGMLLLRCEDGLVKVLSGDVTIRSLA